jgi:hypothetical protein
MKSQVLCGDEWEVMGAASPGWSPASCHPCLSEPDESELTVHTASTSLTLPNCSTLPGFCGIVLSPLARVAHAFQSFHQNDPSGPALLHPAGHMRFCYTLVPRTQGGYFDVFRWSSRRALAALPYIPCHYKLPSQLWALNCTSSLRSHIRDTKHAGSLQDLGLPCGQESKG